MNNNYSYKKLNDLHRRLNRIDVEKDALYADVNIRGKTNLDFFRSMADDLFGEIPIYKNSKNKEKSKYDNEKDKLENEIKYYISNMDAIFLNNSETENEIEDYSSNTYTFLKEEFYDAGPKPYSFIRNIKNLITPATYIDTATKIKTDNIIPVCFNIPLNHYNFDELAIPQINKLDFKFNRIHTLFNINLDISFNKDIKVTFNRNYKPETGDIEYFKGNPTKNKWFTTVNKSIINERLNNEAKTYILCKLIGDALQVYYAKLYIDSLKLIERNKACMFTNDVMVCLRSLLFNIPVIYSGPIEKMNLSFYYYQSNDKIPMIKNMYFGNVKTYNISIIKIINQVITLGEFYLYNVKVMINKNINNFLQEIISYIEQNNKDLEETQLESFENIEQYRRYIYEHFKCMLPFGKVNEDYYLYDSMSYISNISLKNNDIIRSSGNTIGVIIQSILPMVGGAVETLIYNNEPQLYETDFKNELEYSNYIDELMTENVGYANKVCIYYNLLKKYDNKKTIFNYLQNIYRHLHMFQDYIGISIANDGFIKILIKLYEENKLQTMLFRDLEKIFLEWRETMENKKKVEEEEKKEESEEQTIPKTRKRGRSISVPTSYVLSQRKNKTKKVGLSKRRK